MKLKTKIKIIKFTTHPIWWGLSLAYYFGWKSGILIAAIISTNIYFRLDDIEDELRIKNDTISRS